MPGGWWQCQRSLCCRDGSGRVTGNQLPPAWAAALALRSAAPAALWLCVCNLLAATFLCLVLPSFCFPGTLHRLIGAGDGAPGIFIHCCSHQSPRVQALWLHSAIRQQEGESWGSQGPPWYPDTHQQGHRQSPQGLRREQRVSHSRKELNTFCRCPHWVCENQEIHI